MLQLTQLTQKGRESQAQIHTKYKQKVHTRGWDGVALKLNITPVLQIENNSCYTDPSYIYALGRSIYSHRCIFY